MVPPHAHAGTDGTDHDAAPPSPRPTRPPGGPRGPFRHGDVVRREAGDATRRLYAVGSGSGCGMDENRSGDAWDLVAYGSFDRAGPAGAVQTAREDRGASLRGVIPRATGSDAPFAPPAYRRRRGDFRFTTHAGGEWDDSGRQLDVKQGRRGAKPRRGWTNATPRPGAKRSRRPTRRKRWMMVAVAQWPERRTVNPEAEGSTPPGHPSVSPGL